MKPLRPIIDRLLHVVVLLAVVHAQIAFAAPCRSTLPDTGCSRHMTEHAAAADDSHGAHHGHHTAASIQADGRQDSRGVCPGGDCCNGCSVCGHCSAGILLDSLQIASSGDGFAPELVRPPRQRYLSLILHPPNRSRPS